MKNINRGFTRTLAGMIAVAGMIGALEAQTFTRINSGALVTDSSQTLTVAWADFDGDGLVDPFLPAAVNANNFLYRSLGGGSFQSLFNSPPAQGGGDSTAAAWGDYDNDGQLDLFVANRGQNHFLYRGLGGTNFAQVTSSTVLAGGPETYHCAWVDYDGDGHLDLYVVNLGGFSALYRNNGNGTFTKNTAATIANVSASWIGSAWGDYNNDGRPDVFMAAANGQPDALYRNDGNGVFTSTGTGSMVSDNGGATSACWADYDNDGDLDLFVANRDGVNFLYRNNGSSTFEKVTSGEIVTDIADSNAGAWGDYDNDVWLDLYVANGDTPPNEANFLYRNNRDGTFTKVTTGLPSTDTEFSASPAWVDYDNDGDLDLFIANATGGNTLYRNDGNASNWFKARLVGNQSNRSGIGGRITVTAQINGATVSQLREINGDGGFTAQNLEAHFGLGNATSITSVRVDWPSGQVTILNSVSPNQRLTIQENGPTMSRVVPAGLGGNDGNYYAGTLYANQMRSQVVYDAANFSGEPLTITELRFRRDINEPAFNNASATVTVKLSTTPRAPGGLSTTFSQNSGPDETIVFNGVWLYSSPSVLPPGTVRPFEIVLPLSAPFTYNPSAGNLLFDIRISGNTQANWTDGVSSSQLSRVQAPFDAGSSTGAAEQTGDVIQLVYQAAPTLSIFPNGGTFTNSVQVSIQSGYPNSYIRYTTNGSDPEDASQTYTGPFTLTQTRTVKARLFVNGFPASDIVEAAFTRYVPPDIQFLPPGQLFTNQITVTLTNHVGAGVIRFTSNGTDPTASSQVYSGPFTFGATVTIKAQVFLNTFPVSLVFTESYARVYSFGDDGIPFDWRETHFGPGYLTDPDAAADADPDGDFFTNLEEFTGGTDPNVTASAPGTRLRIATAPKLLFNAVPGRTYRIERATDVDNPVWEIIAGPVVAQAAIVVYVDAEAPDNSFYQIVEETQ